MNVKQVVAYAKKYVADIYEDEQIFNLGLEEVEYSEADKVWAVTVGFSRTWNTVRNVVTVISGEPAAKRSYKVVKICDLSGEVMSVKDREKVLS